MGVSWLLRPGPGLFRNPKKIIVLFLLSITGTARFTCGCQSAEYDRREREVAEAARISRLVRRISLAQKSLYHCSTRIVMPVAPNQL